MSEVLKPCPFCGGEMTVYQLSVGYVNHYSVRRPWVIEHKDGVDRDDCSYRMSFYDTEAKAIEAWNRRSERHAKRIIVANGATGHCNCSLCGGLIGIQDLYCKHCGACLEVES